MTVRAVPRPVGGRRGQGFSLIELALVIAIIGLLLGAILGPLVTRIELRQIQEERRRQAEIHDALIGFAIENRRLPCPDNDGDGLEDTTQPNDGPCAIPTPPPDNRFLPYQSLGVGATDTWGRLYLYWVHPDFVRSATPGAPSPNSDGLDLQDPADPTTLGIVEDRNELKDPPVRLTTSAAVIVVSTGPNGHGGTDMEGNVIPVPPSPPELLDEAENLDDDNVFRFRSRTESRDDCSDTSVTVTFFCEFDDMVTWIPTNLLKMRLVQAGVLP